MGEGDIPVDYILTEKEIERSLKRSQDNPSGGLA